MLMKPAFAGVEKMLIRKKFPMNIRALRIICLEPLRGLIDEKTNHKDLDHLLQRLSDQKYDSSCVSDDDVCSSRAQLCSEKKSNKDRYNTDVIFSCVLFLLGTNQIDFDKIFDFELAAVPSSLFKESGEARYPNSRSVLMTKLKIEESTRGIKPESVVIDGGRMLHIIHWLTAAH